MKLKQWELRFASSLIALSAVLFAARAILFAGDGTVLGADPFVNEMLRYLLDDLAFVPISVLLVTLVIQRMMDIRDRDSLLHKLNMVVGAFFSEVGRPLIDSLRTFDLDDGALTAAMGFRTGWKAADFDTVQRALNGFDHSLDATRGDLLALRELLTAKRPFLLGLLQNPNLLEHETFTELLWAVLHLQEELDARSSFEGLPASDLAHLSGDLKRAYNAILVEWLAYMRHLSTQYPYLYSLAVRRNPYDPEPSVEVRT